MPVMQSHQAARLKKLIDLFGVLDEGDIKRDFRKFVFEYIDTITFTDTELENLAQLTEEKS